MSQFSHIFFDAGRGAHHGRFLFWADEVCSLNPLRSDMTGKFVCFQVTMMEWPEWLRSTDYGWIPLAIIPASAVKDIAGQLSGVWRKLMHLLFTARPYNFSSGWGRHRFGASALSPHTLVLSHLLENLIRHHVRRKPCLQLRPCSHKRRRKAPSEN